MVDDTFAKIVPALTLPFPCEMVGLHTGDADIIAKTKEHIANYKCPRSVSFRTAPFPLSGAGKILKRDVRKPYWEGKERQIN